MSDNIISSADMMIKVANITMPIENQELPNVWKSVVSNIHSKKYESEDSEKRMPIGERLAGNTRVIDLKNGVLLVETDHSGWIQYLNMYKKFILTGLKMKLPELKITSLAFRVSGSNVSLSESYEEHLAKEKKIAEEKFEKQEQQLNEYYKNKKNDSQKSSVKSELPPEMLSIFESIKRDMLTNGDK